MRRPPPQDNVGNRYNYRTEHVPQDNIGNRVEELDERFLLPDNLGNRYFSKPFRLKEPPYKKKPSFSSHREHPAPKQQEPLQEEEPRIYILKSDPEEKRLLALNTVQVLMYHIDKEAKVEAVVQREDEQPMVQVTVKQGTDFFSKDSYALSSIVFIANKIINRYPDDRIRLNIRIEN